MSYSEASSGDQQRPSHDSLWLPTSERASGLLAMETAADAAKVDRWVFVYCVPFAAIGLIAMRALVRDRTGKSQQWQQ